MRSRRTSLSSLLSTCSTMGIGGVASGTQLISGIAGGWPLPMGHRPAIRHGGLHGSSAVGHSDVATMVLLGWCLVRQWIQVPASTYCGGASFCSSSKWWILLFLQRQVRTVQTCYAAVTFTHSANCAERDTQLAEQLVEVPTIASYSWLQLRLTFQFPGRGGGISGLHGSLPGQSSTALPSLERISERIVEQNVEFPVGGGLQDFLPGQSSSATSSSPAGVRGSADRPVEGVFRTFPQIKKSATVGSHSGSELLPESSPSTPAAHVDTWVDGDDVWIRIDSVRGPFWKRLLSDHVQWHPPWERH